MKNAQQAAAGSKAKPGQKKKPAGKKKKPAGARLAGGVRKRKSPADARRAAAAAQARARSMNQRAAVLFPEANALSAYLRAVAGRILRQNK